MVSSEATIDMFLGQEGGYFTEAPRRKKRKSGAHKPARPAYMKPKQLNAMHRKGEMATGSYHALTEILADRSAKAVDLGGLTACVNRDYDDVVFARIDNTGESAEVYSHHCVGKDNEYEQTQRLLNRGFRCTVWDEKTNGRKVDIKLVECDPAAKTAAVYGFNFSNPDKAKLWVIILEGQGYEVKTQGM